MTGDLTINSTGSKIIYIQDTRNEKNRFTVVLTCFADGSKFPFIIIFKEKHWPKTTPPQPLGIQVWFQDNGWMDEINMKKYSRYWLSKNLDNSSKMLIYDSFSAHITPDIKASFKNNNTDLVVIPGGLTSICQPLDVSINKPFKNNLRRQWHNWMANGGDGITKDGNLKRASLRSACQWVLNT